LFKTFNLDQNDPDLEIPFFPIQDQAIHLTFMQHWTGSPWSRYKVFKMTKSELPVL